MAGINQWTVVGNVGRDAATRRGEDGTTTVSFSLAVDRQGNDTEPLWVSVLATGRLAEILARDGLVKKGVLALVVGRVELAISDRKHAYQEPNECHSDRANGWLPELLCIASQVWVLTAPHGKTEGARSKQPMQAERYRSHYVSRLLPTHLNNGRYRG